MTALYRPVLIETAEQAEALPAGTTVKRTAWHKSGDQDHYAGVKVGFNAWFTTSPTADRRDALSRHMVGWTALVPIEAVEQHITAKLVEDSTHPDGMRAFLAGETPADMTRHVTPWTPKEQA